VEYYFSQCVEFADRVDLPGFSTGTIDEDEPLNGSNALAWRRPAQAAGTLSGGTRSSGDGGKWREDCFVTPGKSTPPSRRRNPRRLSAASHFVTTLLAVGPVGCHSSQGVTSPSPLASQTYYVSKDGSDSRSCAQAQSTGTPKQTIAGLACLTAAGDTLLIRAGTYNEAIIQTQFVSLIPSGTSWTNIVRVAAYPGETVWMAPLGSQSLEPPIPCSDGTRSATTPWTTSILERTPPTFDEPPVRDYSRHPKFGSGLPA
jgi:hypothetical protein